MIAGPTKKSLKKCKSFQKEIAFKLTFQARWQSKRMAANGRFIWISFNVFLLLTGQGIELESIPKSEFIQKE